MLRTKKEDKEKCKKDRKFKKEKYWYRCKSADCDDQCVFIVIFDGSQKILKEIRCECRKLPDKWDTEEKFDNCIRREKKIGTETIDNKEYDKAIFVCASEGCADGKQCVLYFKMEKETSDGYGKYVSYRCECVNWETVDK